MLFNATSRALLIPWRSNSPRPWKGPCPSYLFGAVRCPTRPSMRSLRSSMPVAVDRLLREPQPLSAPGPTIRGSQTGSSIYAPWVLLYRSEKPPSLTPRVLPDCMPKAGAPPVVVRLSDAYLNGPIETERSTVWHGRCKPIVDSQFVVVAEESREMIGLACAYGATDPQGGTLVDNLPMAVAHKRRGIGARLMSEVASWSARR